MILSQDLAVRGGSLLVVTRDVSRSKLEFMLHARRGDRAELEKGPKVSHSPSPWSSLVLQILFVFFLTLSLGLCSFIHICKTATIIVWDCPTSKCSIVCTIQEKGAQRAGHVGLSHIYIYILSHVTYHAIHVIAMQLKKNIKMCTVVLSNKIICVKYQLTWNWIVNFYPVYHFILYIFFIIEIYCDICILCIEYHKDFTN